QDFLKDAATSIGCPIDFLGVMALGALGAAIGNSSRLELKPNYRVSSCLYAVIVGEPDDGKSAALEVIDKPFQILQNELLRGYNEDHKQWLIDRQTARQNKTQAPDPPSHPQRVLTRDFTIEALIRRLDEAPRGLLCSIDELSGLLTGLNQYKG